MEIKERIIQIIELLNLSPSEFADQLDVQRSSISHITSGRNKPSLDFIEKVHNKFPDLNTDWLLFGKGFPFMKNNKTTESSTPTLFKKPKEVESKIKTESKEEDKVPYNILGQEKNATDDSKREDKSVKNIVIIYEDDTFAFINPKK